MSCYCILTCSRYFSIVIMFVLLCKKKRKNDRPDSHGTFVSQDTGRYFSAASLCTNSVGLSPSIQRCMGGKAYIGVAVAILIMAGFGPQSTKQKKDRTARVKQKRRTFAPHREIRPSDGPHKPCLWKSSYFYNFRDPPAQTLLCLPSYLLCAIAREKRKKGRGRGPKRPFLLAGGGGLL